MAMQPCGLTFEYDRSKDPMDPMQLVYNLSNGVMEWGRVDPFSIKVNGQPLNFEGVYWVALNEALHDFLKANKLDPYASMETGLFLYNVVRDFMSERKVLEYRTEGRVIDTSVK
jgi:hypothetical protein